MSLQLFHYQTFKQTTSHDEYTFILLKGQNTEGREKRTLN